MQKIKSSIADRQDSQLFYMSLEEAKRAIIDDYDFLQDRWERSKAAKKRPA